MKNLQRRFETVPLAEVLAKAVEVSGDWRIENLNRVEKFGRVLAGDDASDVDQQPMAHEPQTAQVQPETAGLMQQREMATGVPAQPKRVLVVDDEQHIANTVAAMVRNMGYEGTASYDSVSGWSQCEALRPDLIIIDAVMPVMSGIELGILVKEFYPACKILLIAEVSTTADLLRLARQSGYDFELLPKPLQLADLLARIAALIEGNHG